MTPITWGLPWSGCLRWVPHPGGARCPPRQLAVLTYDGGPAHGLRGSAAPGGPAGGCPAAHGSLGEEGVLQRLGLPRAQQHLEQLPLPPHPLGEGAVGGGSHGLEAQLRSQAPPRLPLHLHESFVQKRFHVGHFGNWLKAEPAGSQRLTWGREMELQNKASPSFQMYYFQTLFHRLGWQSASSSPIPALGLAWHSELGLELKLLTLLLISSCSDNCNFSSPFSDFRKSKTLFSNK